MTDPTGEPRSCLNCGRPITVSTRNPRKRFCSPRCRVADWHRRHDRPAGDTTGLSAIPEQAYAANAVPNGVPASTRCPHCGQAVTAITLLVPPAAAHVTTPTAAAARHG